MERVDHDAGLTSLHVHRARDGDLESIAWVVSRFTPFLQAQAEYRLRGALRRYCDPEDLVDDVWATSLPRLKDLRGREGQLSPVLMKFLSTTLIHKTNHLLTRYARSKRHNLPLTEEASSGAREGIDLLPDEVSGVVTRAQQNETCQLVLAGLEKLDPMDKEALVLRGIEQLPYAEIASRLGATVGAVTMRYRRALDRLRAKLPGAVLDELLES